MLDTEVLCQGDNSADFGSSFNNWKNYVALVAINYLYVNLNVGEFG